VHLLHGSPASTCYELLGFCGVQGGGQIVCRDGPANEPQPIPGLEYQNSPRWRTGDQPRFDPRIKRRSPIFAGSAAVLICVPLLANKWTHRIAEARTR
jgi:hypothetical protein